MPRGKTDEEPGGVWVSDFSPPLCSQQCPEGVSGEPDVASGDHLVSVLKGWGASQELDPWDSDKRGRQQCSSAQCILNSGSCLFSSKNRP